jgi:hypothetical protein
MGGEKDGRRIFDLRHVDVPLSPIPNTKRMYVCIGVCVSYRSGRNPTVPSLSRYSMVKSTMVAVSMCSNTGSGWGRQITYSTSTEGGEKEMR